MTKKIFLLTITALLTANVWGQSQNFNNGNLENVNAVWINDPGPEEGVKWLSTAANWAIDVSPEDRSNADGNLNFYGSANKIVLWRPTIIKGNTSYLYLSSLQATTGNKNWYFAVGSDGKFGLSTANDDYTWSSSVLKIDRNGNIGIGTTSPLSKLDVNGTITLSGDNEHTLQKLANGILSSGESTEIKGRNIEVYAYDNVYLRAGTQDNIQFHAGTGEKMRILSNGNVGIGTSNPYETLELKRDGQVNLLLWDNTVINGTTQANINFWGSDASYSSSNPTAQIKFLRTESGALGNIVFGTRGEGFTLNEAMRIKSDGSVGIGTTTTGTHKLAVEGTIGAREIKVEAGTWADFVFETDYNLMSLGELETFIQQNKHLPEIPTETEVKQNGISVGEMNAKLLQKVEELTLYLLDQQKEIENLKEEVKQLKSNQ